MGEMSEFLSKVKEFFGDGSEAEIGTFLDEISGMIAVLESRLSDMQPGVMPSQLDETLRAAHTMKGMTAQFGLLGVSRIVHRLEDTLIPLRDRGIPPTESLITLGLQAVDRLKAILDDLRAGKDDAVLSDPALVERLERREEPVVASDLPPHAVTDPPTVSSPAAVPAATTEIASIQVPLSLLDKLFSQLGTMAQDTQTSPQLYTQVNDALWTLVTARMLPPESIVTRLRRTIRETAPKLGKKAKLVVSGEMEPIDVSLVKELGEMLMHMLRNGLDHGLETTAEREAAGKSPEGTISICFVKSPEMVRVELRDDGRGIDATKVAAKAVEKGIITREANDHMTNYERLRLVFAPGFSTAAQVTEVSGRGVGMDVVLKSVSKLGGSVEIETEIGSGTRFVLKFPVRYYCVPSLICRLGDQKFAVSVENVERVYIDSTRYRIEDAALLSSDYEGEMIPQIGFSDLDPKLWDSSRESVIVFNFDGTRVALAVDEILSARPSILAPLPRDASLPYLNSAMIDPELGTVFGLNLDEIRRNWNSYMIPEDPRPAKEISDMNEITDSLAEKVRQSLDDQSCKSHLTFLLEDVSDPELLKKAREFYSTQRSQFLSVIEDIGEGEDIAMVLASRYVEYKAHWIQLNIQLQYQSIMKGQADQSVLHRAGILSFLLGRIEPLIDPNYLTSIHELLNKTLAGTEQQ